MPNPLSSAHIVMALLTVVCLAPLVTIVVGVRRPALTGKIAIFWSGVAFLLSLFSLGLDPEPIDWPWASSIGVRFHLSLDGLAQEFVLLATGIGCVVLCYASAYLPVHLHHGRRSEEELPRFFGFFLLFMAAMVGLVMAEDAILQFVFWDVTAIASFYLIGFDRDQDDSRDSAMMALLVTGTSAVLVLIGALMLGASAGTFQLPVLLQTEVSSRSEQLAVALIVVGALAKSAQVPLHFWLPKAMAAPTPVSAYLHSAAMVAAGVFLVRRWYPLVEQVDWLMNALVVVGFLSIAVGGVLAISRDNLKQILAYSTISQYGYVVVLLGLGTEHGVMGSMFYVLVHALVKSALFLTAGAVTEVTGSKTLSGSGGLWRTHPALALGSGLAAAGMIALPLTAGFFKDEVFFVATWERSPVLGVLAALSAGLTFAYISRFWFGVFLGAPPPDVKPIDNRLVWPIVTLGVATLLAGFWIEPLRRVAEKAGVMPDLEHPELHLAYHLDLRAANVMAVAAWGIGIVLLLTSRWWMDFTTAAARFGDRFGPEVLYRRSLTHLEVMSGRIHRVEVRDLRSRVASILFPAGVLVGMGVLVTPNQGAFIIGDLERGDIPLVTMLLATALSAIVVALPRDHLRLVITLSGLGFSLAMIYALLGAPDVALVAVLMETILGVFFLCVLQMMPRSILQYETRQRAPKMHLRRDVAIAFVTGVMAFLVVWGVLSRPAPGLDLINQYEELTPLAHGEAIVTVILADFRGFDTMGEITVIVLVMLGVMSLMRKGRLR